MTDDITARRMALMNGKNGKSNAQIRREVDAFIGNPETRSRIPSQAEYERRELQEAHAKLEEVRKAPLAERKEAQAAFFEAMRDRPQVVAERIGWLLDGNYGYGAMLKAKQVLGSPRMNRVAALTQMTGAFEWQSPEVMSAAAWKKLSAGEKAKLESAVAKAIRDAEAES